jgi:hypothetical protein
MLTFRQPAVSACGWDARVSRVLPLTEFLGSPGVSSVLSGIRTPNLPLLPQGEKGAGGMRGKSVRECRTSLISPKKSTLERGVTPGLNGRWREQARCTLHRIRD